VKAILSPPALRANSEWDRGVPWRVGGVSNRQLWRGPFWVSEAVELYQSLPSLWILGSLWNPLTAGCCRRTRPLHGPAVAAPSTAYPTRSWWPKEASKSIKALLNAGCTGGRQASRESNELPLEPSRSLVLQCTPYQKRANACTHQPDTRHFAARAHRPCSIHSGPSTTVGGAWHAACKERSVLASARSSSLECVGPIQAMLGLSSNTADTTRSARRSRKQGYRMCASASKAFVHGHESLAISCFTVAPGQCVCAAIAV
jgi:hypothetical protein